MHPTSLGYRTDIALLRLGGSRVKDRGDHLVVSSPHAPTFWWGNFLLLARVPDPPACQAWLDCFVASFPGALHVAIGFDETAGTLAELAWFAERAFSAEALTVMTGTGPHRPVRVNGDAVYRALRSDDDWMRSVELRARCTTEERAVVSSGDLDTARALTNRRIAAAGHGRWFGAFVGDLLVAQLGLVAAGPELARFQSVETDPDFRRRGLARSLIHHASTYGLTELGARTLVIVADPTYFAIDLYRTLGFVAAETQLMVERKPASNQRPTEGRR